MDSPTKSNGAIVITCELDGDNNCISYFNKQKSQDLFSSLQLQLPKAFNNLDYDTILHQSNNIVKTSGVRIDGIDNKSQMTLERWGEQYSELTSSFNH